MNSAEKKFLYLALFLFALGGVSRLGFLNKVSPLEVIPLPLNLAYEPEMSTSPLSEGCPQGGVSCIVVNDSVNIIEEKEEKKKEKPPKKKAPSFPININTASKDDLCFIKGVGPSTAQKIIDNRPFKSTKDLEKVPGIGPKKRAAMEEFISL